MTSLRIGAQTLRMRAVESDPGLDLQAQLRVQLYSKLAAGLSVAQTPAEPGGPMLSLLVPGQFIRSHLDPESLATQRMIANAFNVTLACSWVAATGSESVADVYKAILDGKQVPLVHLTPEQQAELDAAEDYLFDAERQPSEAYQQYERYQLAYLEALDRYETAVVTHHNGGPAVPPELKERLTAAVEAWRNEGHQHEVDRALVTVGAYEALEPLVFWQRLATTFDEWTRRDALGGEFQTVITNPPYQEWFEEFGWSDFGFEDYDFVRQERSGGAGTGHRCCCCCDDGPDGSGPDDDGPDGSGPDGSGFGIDASWSAALGAGRFRLTCKLRRVQVIRPWLDSNVFVSRAWRWSPGSLGYGSVVSTGGDVAGAVLPNGRMPVLPVTALLAKDVEIDWEDDGGDSRVSGDLFAGSGEAAFGPFNLAGADVRGAGGEHHISMRDPQIIGFLSVVLPRCPDPDPALPWPLLSDPARLTRLAPREHVRDRGRPQVR